MNILIKDEMCKYWIEPAILINVSIWYNCLAMSTPQGGIHDISTDQYADPDRTKLRHFSAFSLLT